MYMKIFGNYIHLRRNCHGYLASMVRENEAVSQGILKAYMSGNPVYTNAFQNHEYEYIKYKYIEITLCHSFVYNRLDQLTDKMSDTDERFDILGDIKPYSFEPLAKMFTDSINCEELAAASADVDLEQPPMLPAWSTTRDELVCICWCWYKIKHTGPEYGYFLSHNVSINFFGTWPTGK